MTTLLAQTETIGNPIANIGIFSLFVVVTMIVVIRASKKNATADEFFTGGRGFSGPQNGIAIAGDYLSAASFLGIAGAIAVYGYDGFLYSIGFLVAWLVALLLVAELMRNTGKFTMADVLSFRLKQRPVRMAAATSTLTVSLFYLLAQMAGAGGLVALLLDIKSRSGPVHRHRRRRRPDDRLRAGRRHEGHHLGADHQGRPADRRRGRHDRHGARQVRPELLRDPRLRAVGDQRRHHRGRRRPRRARPGRAVRRVAHLADQLHLAGAGAGARHRGTAARADALLHRAHRQRGTAKRRLGHRADRRLLPVHPRARSTARRLWSVRTGSSARRAE